MNSNLKVGSLVYYQKFHNQNAYTWSIGKLQRTRLDDWYIAFVDTVDDFETLNKLRKGLPTGRPFIKHGDLRAP